MSAIPLRLYRDLREDQKLNEVALICTETLLYVACLIFLKSSLSGKAVDVFHTACFNVIKYFHIKLSYLGFSPGWRWEKSKKGIQQMLLMVFLYCQMMLSSSVG